MMKQLFLSDKEVRDNLFPFTLTRSVADIRVGILTIREKWQSFLGKEINIIDEVQHMSDDAVIFSGNIIPSKQFIESLITKDGSYSEVPAWETVKIIQYPWHIFMWNDWALRQDFDLITSNRKSLSIPDNVQVIDPQNVFIEPGATLSHCIINASEGPVYIGRNAQVMEGALIRGPFALCEGATVKMGARIYGASTVGPFSVVGGEVKNTVILGYSNKAHDGYIGDSVIGEWCNLGAGSSNSNVKNTGGPIKMWNHSLKEYILAGNKCGLIMGDYSRCAINTSFNTGTVVGLCSNIFGEGLTQKFIPSFTWGNKVLSKYDFDKALNDIENWKKLKGRQLSGQERAQLKLIFEKS